MGAAEHVVLSGWSLEQARQAFPSDASTVFEVHDGRTTSAALEAAAGGSRVVAVVPADDPDLVDALVDALRRIGPVRVGPPPGGVPETVLDPDGAAILALMVEGSTLRQAASRLGLRLRTADRRLAAARRTLGVRSTAEAVVAYAALRRGAAGSPSAAPSTGGAPRPFVGRARERRRLADLCAADESVLVVGEGGIGKSALLTTVTGADGRPVFAGGCQSALRWKQYWPLARAVGKPELTGDVEAVASEVESLVGPDLLVIDDVHLADDATVAVLAALVGRTTVIAAARPPSSGDDGAVGRLRDAGFVAVPLDPLDDDAASELARALAPGLSSSQLTNVVDGAGGLPLLLEFLCHGDDTVTRGRGLVPAVAGLSPTAREDALRLALASRPLAPEPTTDELVAAGVATRLATGEVRIRHALVADAVLTLADPVRVADAHRDLAAVAPGPGTAARHWWAAGDADMAYAAALEAADASSTVGERAEHLRLAALAAPAVDRVPLLLRAAGELSLAVRHDAVLELLADLSDDDPSVTARAHVLRARAYWHAGDAPLARRTARSGLALVSGSGTMEEGALLTETVRCEAMSLGPQPEHDAMLTRALALTADSGQGRAAILNTQRIVRHLTDGTGMAEWTAGIAAAEAEDDLDVVMRCSNNLVSWHETAGDPEEGLRLAHAMAATAQQHGLGEWHGQFLAMAGNLLMHRGRFAEALATLEAAEAGAVDIRTRAQARLARASVLTDLGLFDAAQASIGAVPEDGIVDEKLDFETRYQLAVLALYSGRPKAARELLRGRPHNPAWADMWFAMTVDAWAAYEIGADVPEPPAAVPMPFVAGMQRELEGLHVLPSDPAAAAALFDEAVEVGRPWSYAPSVRAQWAAGEARRLAGAPDAVVVLLEAEEEATRSRLEPMLVRIRRSLRHSGIRRSAPRAVDRSGLVTERERTVLELVAQGATDVEIGRRLGVGRPTVRRLVDSARYKLGAADRMSAAAALAAQDQRPS